MNEFELNKRLSGNLRPNAAYERSKVKGSPIPKAPNTIKNLPNWSNLVPIAYVPDSDPELALAVEEANRRFGEFVKAFEDRQPDETFAIKAAFQDDFGKEFMWLSVSKLENDEIYGHLDNQPSCVKSVKCGQPVKVLRQDINDWLYMRDNQMYGGFTVKVLDAKRRRKSDR